MHQKLASKNPLLTAPSLAVGESSLVSSPLFACYLLPELRLHHPTFCSLPLFVPRGRATGEVKSSMSVAEGPSISVDMGDRPKVEGAFVCVDPVTHSLLVKSAKNSYKLINPAFIKGVEGSLASLSSDVLPLEGLDMATLEKREQLAHKNAEEGLKSLNFSVSIEAQNLFDRLQKL